MPAYTSSRYVYEGTETTETTITRVGGATDPTGQVQSRKIVTTANAQWIRPFKAQPYAVWNATTGANVTATIYGLINSNLMGNNDDVWAEFEYLGSSSSTLGSIVHTTKANLLAASAALTADSSTWNNSTNVPTTFDPGTLTNVALSNGNKTVTLSSASMGGARSSLYKSSGKWYCEFTIGATSTGGDAAGIIIQTGTYTEIVISGFSCLAAYTSNGNIWANSANSGKTLGSIVAGNVVSVAIDLTNLRGWIRKNGGNWNGDATADPVTGVGAVTIPASYSWSPVVTFGSSGAANNMTGNFGQSAFAYTVPTGFELWGNFYTPFKLSTTLSSPQPGQAGYIHARIRAGKAGATYYIDPQVYLS